MEGLASNAALIAANSEWATVSRTPTTVTTIPVTGGFVDDVFDTQRRRGETNTSRLSWSIL